MCLLKAIMINQDTNAAKDAVPNTSQHGWIAPPNNRNNTITWEKPDFALNELLLILSP